MCSRCYRSFSEDTVTTVVPYINDEDTDLHDDDTSIISDNVDDIEEYNNVNDEENNDDEVCDDYNGDKNTEFENHMENFIVASTQDESLDQTEDNIESNIGFINTTSGDLAVNIQQNNKTDHKTERVCGHVIFNQVGSCTTRGRHTITGTNRQKHFIQSLCATSPGQACPLLQPEASLFPRHFPSNATNDKCTILGAQPLFLLNSKKSSYGFTPMINQARVHMTNPSSTTSTDMSFMSYYFDALANMMLSSCDSRDIFQRGFTVDNDNNMGMKVRDKGESELAESVDSRQMVVNLSSLQKYVKYTWFLTFTANQSQHPGIKHLHAWKESMEWTKNYINYKNLSSFEKDEIKKAMEEAYGVHLYSAWNTVKMLLLKHIKLHCTILGSVLVIFARDEYQKTVGNLSHNHLITAVDTSTMNGNTEKFIQDLIRTNVMELVKTDKDLERLINEELLSSEEEINEITNLAETVLPHKCDDRCKIRVGDDNEKENFKCRKLHPVRDNPDPTSHSYVPIPYKFQQHTLDILLSIGMYSICPTTGEELFTHPYFQPKRHIAPCNINAKCNMSPVIVDFFIATRSMQNAQALENTNGTSKYVCKYIAKFDDGNYVLLCQDVQTGQFILCKAHLHNTKIVTSKINEDKAFEKNRQSKHPKGRDMAHFEIRQILMGDPEVFTNLEFIQISTLPFELRPSNKIHLQSDGNIQDNNVPDAFISGIKMQRIRMAKLLPPHRLMTENQITTYKNHHGKASQYDMISLFSLRPPELFGIFTNVEDFFRCCYIEHDKLSDEEIENGISLSIDECEWINCLGQHIMIRNIAIPEVKVIISKNIDELEIININDRNEKIQFNIEMNKMLLEKITIHATENDSDILDRFLYKDSNDILPVPVFSNSSPANAHNFIVHIILSMGEFETEIDAFNNTSIRECLKKVKLIGNSTDVSTLMEYSEKLTRRYIEEQLVNYPNSLNKAEAYIIMAKRVFDDAIILEVLSINELPPFTMSSLCNKKTKENEDVWNIAKEQQLKSIYSTLCNTNGIPEIDSVQQTERNSPIQWDPTGDIEMFCNQTEESFEEQQLAISHCVHQINKYCNISGHNGMIYNKNAVVYGAPGTGKSFVGQLVVLYALSQGLNVISTALMGVRANTLGGKHLHKILHLPTDINASTSPFRIAEKAIEKIKRNNTSHYRILTTDILFIDELGQVSSEQLATTDIILRKIRDSQIPFGGVLIIGTMDHMQLQPIKQLPLLTSSLILTCFQMVELNHSVRAHGDTDFQRLQQITRMNPYILSNSNEIKNEFYELCSRILTFVSSWDDHQIGPNMMRAFSRIHPAQNALNEYRESIKRQLTSEGIEYCIASSYDSQRTQNTRAEYNPASQQTIKYLNKEHKEPSELVFFAGGVYECTINDQNGRYSQSQMAYMLQMPSQDDVDQYKAIPLWIAPAGTINIDFDRHQMPSRQQLITSGWNEVKIGVTPERIIPVRGGLHAKRKQYALKHIGATTINKSLGATLPMGLAVEITRQYSPWEKGQIVVLLSRTTSSKNTIIVGEKEYAIKKMWEVITLGNQWTQFTENVLNTVSINRDGENRNQSTLDYIEAYPFRVCDSSIPTDTTGFVYCLVSLRDSNAIYIGETKCLAQRLDQHNRGNGAQGTNDTRLMPWGLAAYICGLSHMSKSHRMSLERDWKLLVEESIDRGYDDSFSWINAGSRIVESYNEFASENKIHFIRCISQETTSS